MHGDLDPTSVTLHAARAPPRNRRPCPVLPPDLRARRKHWVRSTIVIDIGQRVGSNLVAEGFIRACNVCPAQQHLGM